MTKITILTVIAVSVSAQFTPERRPHERDDIRISSDEPGVNPKFWEEGLRVNQRHMHRGPEDRRAGGFQNGNFAHHDGRLRTNLDFNPTEYSGQNFQLRLDNPYVVEEGAAFRRPDNRKFDVHSNQGRTEEKSAQEDEDFKGRRQTQNLEQRPNQNINGQVSSIHRGKNLYEQTNTRSVNNQNNQHGNRRDEGQSYSQQSDQNTDYNAQRGARNSNQNDKQTTSVVNQPEKNQNSEGDFKKNENPFTSSVTNSTATVKEYNKKDMEAMEKEINNQITKMIFDASVQEVTTKSNIKTTTDDKLDPARSMKKEEDRWIWNMTSTTSPTPGLDDRAAFVGDQCPTNQVRFNNVCVDKD